MLQDRWDPAVAVDLVAAERASYTLAATTFLQDLVEESARRGARLDTLRCFGCGGAPVPPALVAAADQQGIRVLRLYGSTEVLVGTWNRPDTPLEQRMDTDGIAMTDVEVEIRHDDGDAVRAGRARRDLRARSEHVRRLLRRPGAHGRDVRRRRVGTQRRPRGRGRRTGT